MECGEVEEASSLLAWAASENIFISDAATRQYHQYSQLEMVYMYMYRVHCTPMQNLTFFLHPIKNL